MNKKDAWVKLWGDINIKMAMVEINKSAREVFSYNDIFYDRDGKELESFLLTKPVNYTKISSLLLQQQDIILY